MYLIWVQIYQFNMLIDDIIDLKNPFMLILKLACKNCITLL